LSVSQAVSLCGPRQVPETGRLPEMGRLKPALRTPTGESRRLRTPGRICIEESVGEERNVLVRDRSGNGPHSGARPMPRLRGPPKGGPLRPRRL